MSSIEYRDGRGKGTCHRWQVAVQNRYSWLTGGWNLARFG